MGPDELLVHAATELSQPAGASPQFSSLEGIGRNRSDFVVECHKTWKKWQRKAIEEILLWEAFAKREKIHPIGNMATEWAAYNQAVWRRVNDAIIWSLMGCRRHVVKRLCLHRARSSLTESNPDSVLQTLAHANANPMSIAIWNDATSCVDIGDLTYAPNGLKPHPYFLELKDGKVNDDILTLLRTDAREFDAKFSEFEKKYGKKGVAQFNRARRQNVVSGQALTLLNEEKGIDPITGEYMTVVDVDVPPESYDATLSSVLQEALKRRTAVTEVIDGCLWIYVNADKTISAHQAQQDFLKLLCDRLPGARQLLDCNRPGWDADRIVRFGDSFFDPFVFPIFIRNIDSNVIGEIGYGDLMFRVFLYVDWDKFGDIVKEEGGIFSWSSEKEARRARAKKPAARPGAVIRGRLAQIGLGDIQFAVTDRMLVQILFDGLRPRVIAKQTIELATRYGNL